GPTGAHSPPRTYLMPLRARNAVRSTSRRTVSSTSPTARSAIGAHPPDGGPLGVRRGRSPVCRGIAGLVRRSRVAKVVDTGRQVADLVRQGRDLVAEAADVIPRRDIQDVAQRRHRKAD